jgi:heme/copper-type cytochrome/quinol oxidase subunit 3
VLRTPTRPGSPGPGKAWPRRAVDVLSWGSYLPFWNTVILLSSSVTVHFAHTAIKNHDRTKLLTWLGLTVLLGIIFLVLQVEEYLHAYNDLGLTLDSGIYGSTFFLLTGFHGFHVTLGTFILLIQLAAGHQGALPPRRLLRLRGGLVVLALRRRRLGDAVPVHLCFLTTVC